MEEEKSTRALISAIFDRITPSITPERRDYVYRQLQDASSPDFDFFLLTILSAIIATQGLLIDSPAVIIGAMLVAPLMSPIVGMGMASILGDEKLLRQAGSAVARGAFLAVLLAFLLTSFNIQLPFISINPLELPQEVLSRTQPSPIDLIVALAGGFAAAFALAMPHISAALPGVAIATALMPPLCTIGVGIATGQWDVAGGALLLFITNTVTIAFSATLIFSVLKFRPLNGEKDTNRMRRSIFVSGILTAALLIPLTVISVQFVQDASENSLIDAIITEEVGVIEGVDLTNWQVERSEDNILIELDIRTTAPLLVETAQELQNNIGARLQDALEKSIPVEIILNQVLAVKLDPAIPPTFTITPTTTSTPTSTYTNTPGPSPTATPTKTATRLPTITPTSTTTSTPTHTSTPTRTPTPTTESGSAVLSFVPSLALRQSPGGPVISSLYSGEELTILYGEVIYNGLVWVEVMDSDGRIGWIPLIYLIIYTPEPTSTPTSTPTQPVTVTSRPTSTFTFTPTVTTTPATPTPSPTISPTASP